MSVVRAAASGDDLALSSGNTGIDRSSGIRLRADETLLAVAAGPGTDPISPPLASAEGVAVVPEAVAERSGVSPPADAVLIVKWLICEVVDDARDEDARELSTAAGASTVVFDPA
jgi:hypothetical protein